MVRRLLSIACLVVVPSVAHADLLPDNAKVALHRIVVHAELPPGKALVVENTWNMPTLVEPEQPTSLSWKAMDGEMRLRLVDRVNAPPPRPADGRRPDMFVKAAVAERTRRAASRATVCSEVFSGRTVIPAYSPAAEYRHELHVTIAGDRCESRHSAAWLDDKGQPVDPGDIELPPGVGLDGWPAAPPTPVKPATPVPVDAAPVPVVAAPPAVVTPPVDATPPAANGCGCRGGDRSGEPVLLASVLLLVGVRRRATLKYA